MYSFCNFEPVYCSMSGSNCCFLTCIWIPQEAGKMVWYSHLLKNFPEFVVIHTVKGFSVVNEAEVGVFLEFPWFIYDPIDVGNLISGSFAFSKPMLFIWKFSVQVLLKPILKCCLGSPKFTSYEITNHDMKHQTGLIYIFLWWLPYTYVHASFVAQTAKTLPAIQKTQIQSLSWEDPLKKK